MGSYHNIPKAIFYLLKGDYKLCEGDEQFRRCTGLTSMLFHPSGSGCLGFGSFHIRGPQYRFQNTTQMDMYSGAKSCMMPNVRDKERCCPGKSYNVSWSSAKPDSLVVKMYSPKKSKSEMNVAWFNISAASCAI